MLAKPSILVVLNLDVPPHNFCPVLKSLKQVSCNTTALLVLSLLLLLFSILVVALRVLINSRLVDKIVDFQNFVLNLVLFNELLNLFLDARNVSNFKDGRSLVVVFVKEGDHQHLKVRVSVLWQ